MDLGAAVFYLVAAVTIAASLGVVISRNVVYSALLLILALTMTGLVYQAVATSWAPAPVSATSASSAPSGAASGRTVATPGAGAVTGSRAATSATTGASTTGPVRVGPVQLGTALYTTWAVPFEIASLVLLVALLGALLIARSANEPDQAAVAAAARLHS